MDGTGDTAVLDRASALCADGAWDDAIELLGESNRRQRCDDYEIALANTRHKAWHDITFRGDSASPAAASGQPPVGLSGMPELAIGEVTAAAIRAAFESHGSLLIPGALDDNQITRLTQAVDSSFAASRLDEREGELDAWFHPIELDERTIESVGASRLMIRRKFNRDAGGVLFADSPRALFEVLDVYESLGLRQSIADYIGQRVTVSGSKGTLRLVDTDQVGGWHQDGAFLGSDIRALNVWLTLTPCGVDAPGLDIVNRRFDEIVPTGTEGAYFDWDVSDSLVREIAGDSIVRHEFAAGDILLFDEMNLHRTAITPEMNTPRRAIEMWCFSTVNYPSDHVPIVW